MKNGPFLSGKDFQPWLEMMEIFESNYFCAAWITECEVFRSRIIIEEGDDWTRLFDVPYVISKPHQCGKRLYAINGLVMNNPDDWLDAMTPEQQTIALFNIDRWR